MQNIAIAQCGFVIGKVFWKNTSSEGRRRFFQKPEGLDLARLQLDNPEHTHPVSG